VKSFGTRTARGEVADKLGAKVVADAEEIWSDAEIGGW